MVSDVSEVYASVGYVLVFVWYGPVYGMAANDVYEGNHDLNDSSPNNLMDQVNAEGETLLAPSVHWA